MDQLQPFRDEALRRGIPADEVERWIGTARPGMTMVPGPGPGSRIAGQLGGHPLLPENISHPELSFAGSLDCAAVPAGASDLDLPPDGTLLYFAQPDLTAGTDEAAVIYVNAGTPVSERPPRSENVVVFPRSDAHLVIDLILPNRAHNSPLFPHAEALAYVWWDLDHQLVRGKGPLQIGGVPWMEQEDTFEIAAEDAGNQPEDWALLGSWTPEGDGKYNGYFIGSLQMLIRREDVTARRFDRLSLFWQQEG
jgi:hypothetical protein